MLHKFAPDLSQDSIYAQGTELATIMGKDKDDTGNRIYTYSKDCIMHVADLLHPVLVTDRNKINQIQEYIKRETVSTLFDSPFITIDYDGVQMDYEKFKYPGVRSPSIDTLFFCKTLKDIDLSDATTMIEEGSGPGFIAKYVGEKYPNLQQIVLNDINPNALSYFQDHYTDPRFTFHLGDGKAYLTGKRFDIIASNPPYIPRVESIDDNSYEGLSLPIYLIEHIDEILTEKGKLFLNLSSLSLPIMQRYLEDEHIVVTHLDAMDVPLKVFNVLNNPERMDYLITQKGLKQEMRDGHEYRHTLHMYQIQKKQ